MIRETLWVVLLVSSAWGQPEPTKTYSHAIPITKTEGTTSTVVVNAYWEVDQSLITFEIQAKTTGWIGLGFSPNGGMQGADIYVAWVKDGIAQISDRHGPTTGNGFPDKDTEQNVNILAASEEDGWTVVKFSRELAGCEDTDDREITSSTTKVIWAYGEGDPSGDDITASDVHTTTNRGVVSLYLLDPNDPTAGCTPPNGPTYNTHDLVMDSFSLPAADTYYNCRLMRMPTVTGKMHIVKFAPVIQSGNEKYVHHILVFQCGDTVAAEQLDTDAPCYGSGALSHFASCTSVITGWAVGGSESCLPTEAGFPFGGSSGGPVIVQVEIHYDNPDSLSTIVDSSGMQITYTPTLRANDAGVLQVGHVVHPVVHVIPPQAESFTSVGYCAGSCLENAMTAGSVTGLNIYGVLLHSHLAGSQMKLRHIRNGVELLYVGNDENYDFNYQETRKVEPTKEFQSGDIFQMECVYNTQGRTQMTLGGFETTDEMCLAFVAYFPRINAGVCASHPDATLYAFFGVMATDMDDDSDHPGSITVTAPTSLNGQSLLQVMNNFAWDEAQSDAFSAFITGRPQEQFCTKIDATPIAPETISKPTISTPYTVATQTCSIDASTLVQNLTLFDATTVKTTTVESLGRRHLPSVLVGVILTTTSLIVAY